MRSLRMSNWMNGRSTIAEITSEQLSFFSSMQLWNTTWLHSLWLCTVCRENSYIIAEYVPTHYMLGNVQRNTDCTNPTTWFHFISFPASVFLANKHNFSTDNVFVTARSYGPDQLYHEKTTKQNKQSGWFIFRFIRVNIKTWTNNSTFVKI